MKTAARCRAVDCDEFAVAHVVTERIEGGPRIEFDACGSHALGALTLAPLMRFVVSLSDLPCAWCRRPIHEERADRGEPLHAGICAERYDAQAVPS